MLTWITLPGYSQNELLHTFQTYYLLSASLSLCVLFLLPKMNFLHLGQSSRTTFKVYLNWYLLHTSLTLHLASPLFSLLSLKYSAHWIHSRMICALSSLFWTFKRHFLLSAFSCRYLYLVFITHLTRISLRFCMFVYLKKLHCGRFDWLCAIWGKYLHTEKLLKRKELQCQDTIKCNTYALTFHPSIKLFTWTLELDKTTWVWGVQIHLYVDSF